MIRNIFKRIKEYLRGVKSDPINNLGFFVPVVIGLVAFISGIVAFVRFISDGGYVRQIRLLKNYGFFDGTGKSFTVGTTGDIITRIVVIMLVVLTVAAVVVMIINYFKNSGKAKRIIMIVDLSLLAIQTLLATIAIRDTIGNGIINGVSIYLEYVVIIIVPLIAFIVLTLITKECRWMLKYICLSLLFANIAVPLGFLILQNIVPLIIVVLIIMGVYFVLKLIFGSGEESESQLDRIERKVDRLS